MRAGILVTGTEVITARISDRNGPWVSQRLAELGVEVAHILVVADRPDDLEAGLRFMADDGCAADRHQRRPRSHRRRPHRRDRRPLRRGRARARRGHGAEDRPDHRRLRQADALRSRRAAGSEPQAGDDPARRRGHRPGRHGSRPCGRGRRGADGDRAPGTAAGAARDVAGGDRHRRGAGGARPRRAVPEPDVADVRDPRVGDRQVAAGDRARDRPLAARDHHLPASRRARGRDPPPRGRRGRARGAGRRLDRASRALPVQHRRVDDRRAGRRAAARRAADRARRVVHGRPARRAPRRPARRLRAISPAAWSPTRTRPRSSCSAFRRS